MREIEEITALAEWSVDESIALSSGNRGKTPREMGYSSSDLSGIDIDYSIRFYTFQVKLFYQTKAEPKGKTFNVPNISDEVVDLYRDYVEYFVNLRKSSSFLNKIKSHTPVVETNKVDTSLTEEELEMLSN